MTVYTRPASTSKPAYFIESLLINLFKKYFCSPENSVENPVYKETTRTKPKRNKKKKLVQATVHRRNPTVVRHRYAQCCDCENEHSTVTAKVSTVLWHQWLWHQCDSDVYISVTVMATDTAVTAVTTDSAVSVVAADTTVTALSVVTAVTLVCTVVLQCCHCHRCYTTVSLHRWHTNVAAIAVTVLSLPLMLY